MLKHQALKNHGSQLQIAVDKNLCLPPSLFANPCCMRRSDTFSPQPLWALTWRSMVCILSSPVPSHGQNLIVFITNRNISRTESLLHRGPLLGATLASLQWMACWGSSKNPGGSSRIPFVSTSSVLPKSKKNTCKGKNSTWGRTVESITQYFQ